MNVIMRSSAGFCIWMALLCIIPPGIAEHAKSSSRSATEVFITRTATRILSSMTDYSNPYDTFTPSQSMKIARMMGGSKEIPKTTSPQDVKNILIVPVILLVWGLLAVILMNCGFFSRCCCFVCKCYPNIRVDATDEQRVKKIDKRRRIIVGLFYFFCAAALLADHISFKGYSDIVVGVKDITSALASLKNLFSAISTDSSALVADGELLSQHYTTAKETCTYVNTTAKYITDYQKAVGYINRNVGGVNGQIDTINGILSLYAVYYRNIAFFLLWVLALSSVIGMVVFHFLQHRPLLKWAIGWSVSTLIIEILVCFPLLIVTIAAALICSPTPTTNIISLLPQGAVRTNLKYYVTCIGDNEFQNRIDDATSQISNLASNLQTLDSTVCTKNAGIASMIKDLSLINKDLALIRLDVVCKPVRDMWFQFLNTGLCTNLFSGLFSIWMTQLVTSFCLFFAIVMASFAYHYYNNGPFGPNEAPTEHCQIVADNQPNDDSPSPSPSPSAPQIRDIESDGGGGQEEGRWDTGQRGSPPAVKEDVRVYYMNGPQAQQVAVAHRKLDGVPPPVLDIPASDPPPKESPTVSVAVAHRKLDGVPPPVLDIPASDPPPKESPTVSVHETPPPSVPVQEIKKVPSETRRDKQLRILQEHKERKKLRKIELEDEGKKEQLYFMDPEPLSSSNKSYSFNVPNITTASKHERDDLFNDHYVSINEYEDDSTKSPSLSPHSSQFGDRTISGNPSASYEFDPKTELFPTPRMRGPPSPRNGMNHTSSFDATDSPATNTNNNTDSSAPKSIAYVALHSVPPKMKVRVPSPCGHRNRDTPGPLISNTYDTLVDRYPLNGSEIDAIPPLSPLRSPYTSTPPSPSPSPHPSLDSSTLSAPPYSDNTLSTPYLTPTPPISCPLTLITVTPVSLNPVKISPDKVSQIQKENQIEKVLATPTSFQKKKSTFFKSMGINS